MTEIVVGSLPVLTTTNGQNFSELIAMLSEDLESKSSNSIPTRTTTWSAFAVETTSSVSALAVAATDLDFLSDLSFTSSIPTLESVAGLPTITSLFPMSVKASELINTASQTNSSPVAPRITKNSSAEVRNDLNTNLYTPVAPGLSIWSIAGVIIGLTILTSLIVLIAYLVGKRKQRNGFVDCDQISWRSSSNSKKPHPSLRSLGQNKHPSDNFPGRFPTFIRELKNKLGGNRSNLFPYRSSVHERVNLDRGNSQYLDSYTASWFADHKREIDSMNTSKKLWMNKAQDDGISEKRIQLKSEYDLSRFPEVNEHNFQRYVKPDQALLEDKRVFSFDNKSSLSVHDDKSTAFSNFEDNESYISRRRSQIRVSQTITQYSSDSRSSKSPASPQKQSFLSSTFDGNRDSVFSYASCYTIERSNKKKSDQFDLDYPDLWASHFKSSDLS